MRSTAGSFLSTMTCSDVSSCGCGHGYSMAGGEKLSAAGGIGARGQARARKKGGKIEELTAISKASSASSGTRRSGRRVAGDLHGRRLKTRSSTALQGLLASGSSARRRRGAVRSFWALRRGERGTVATTTASGGDGGVRAFARARASPGAPGSAGVRAVQGGAWRRPETSRRVGSGGKQEVARRVAGARRAHASPSVEEEDDREERAGLASWAGQAVLCWASTGKPALFIFLFYFLLTFVFI